MVYSKIERKVQRILHSLCANRHSLPITKHSTVAVHLLQLISLHYHTVMIQPKIYFRSSCCTLHRFEHKYYDVYTKQSALLINIVMFLSLNSNVVTFPKVITSSTESQEVCSTSRHKLCHCIYYI